MTNLIATEVDLTAAQELMAMLRRSSLALKALRDAHPEGSDEYERLHGKMNGVGGALITSSIALKQNPVNSDAVFKEVIEYVSNEIVVKEKAKVKKEHESFIAGLLDGYRVALEQVHTERQFI